MQAKENNVQTKGIVVIVDVYSFRRLAPRFIEAGYTCARVQTTPEPPEFQRKGNFTFEEYCENIIHYGDFEATVAKVARLKPVAIVAGGEIAIEFTDALSERLGLKSSNGTKLSLARRHKYVMIERLRALGLRATKQFLPNNEEELRAWHQEQGGRLVVKPVRSAAGDGIHFCDTPEESVDAYRALIGKTNLLSETNREIVAQEYLRGTEYVVNTVSCAGKHYVTDIWKTTRVAINGILDMGDSIQIMPRTGKVQDALVKYAYKVLDAIGIAYGPAHLEIKLTPGGPCLVEMAARFPGGDMPYYAELAIGEAQLDWAIDAYVNPDRFHARCDQMYRLQYHFASVALLSPYDGVLKSYPFLDQIQKLESFYEVREMVKPGDRIRPTIDDMTYPMLVLLRHQVEETVLRDWGTLRYLDGPSFYEVEQTK